MSDPRLQQIAELQALAAKLQCEVDNDKTLHFKEAFKEFYSSYLKMNGAFDAVPNGPSLYDTHTGANYWSQRDVVEQILETLCDAVEELNEEVRAL